MTARHRDAVTGAFVTKEEADARPRETVAETVRGAPWAEDYEPSRGEVLEAYPHLERFLELMRDYTLEDAARDLEKVDLLMPGRAAALLVRNMKRT